MAKSDEEAWLRREGGPGSNTEEGTVVTCGKDGQPYCENYEQAVKDLLQQIKDYKEAQTASGFNWLAMQAVLGVRYGVTGRPGPMAMFNLNQQLEGAQADLTACRLAHGLEGLGAVGKLAGQVGGALYKYFTA
jgi:hypothetical protein